MDDVRAYLPLSAQQFQILLALSDADRHGYGIILEIAERTGAKRGAGALAKRDRGAGAPGVKPMRLGTGTLYTALAGLEDGRLVVESKKRPAAKDDDQRRRYYRLTPFGRAVLEAETSRLDALVKQARRKGVTPIGRAVLGTGSRTK